uniref:uncharacterized protein LOC122588197 n=1 Tax=Erigeron canadensis TaxID=72917 RepID=UPI001CB8A886|nr:uncharacterized protein LOC122588197 [Erigeron canadensis]
MPKRFGSTILLDEPFEWSDDSSLEIFANAIEADGESSTARSKRKVVNHNRWEAGERLFCDYFFDEPKFDHEFFEDRYRIPKCLFLKIVHDLELRYKYYQEGYDGRMKKSFTAIQKCTSTIRQLATGNLLDEYYEYLETTQRTSRECLQVFCDAIVETYEQEYLHKPTTHDILRLYETHEERRHMPAYKYPTDPKEKKFKRLQESARKDVERAFGVLKQKWGILCRPFRQRSVKAIRNLVYACVIMHNMIIQDDDRAISSVHIGDPRVQPNSQHDRLQEIRDEETHFRLRNDLTEHIAAQELL